MASIRQLGERRENIASIVSFVRKNGAVTRMEIREALALSWACVSDLAADLIREGVLLESAEVGRAPSAAKGRTPTRLLLNGQKYFLGVDINDSGIAIARLSMNGETVASKKWAAELFSDEAALAGSVCEKIGQMLADPSDCCGIGVAMEGARTEDGGWGYPMQGGAVSVHPEVFITRCFGMPVSVRHDPECVLYSVAGERADCLTVRVDRWIGIAAMKGGRILELPFELGWTRYGKRRLQDILRSCAREGDYREIAEALGRSVGNLALLIGINACVLAGEITEWIGSVREEFDAAFREVSQHVSYELSDVSDASFGAARLAMAEYPSAKAERA